MTVNVYSTPSCGACSLLKSYLKGNDVAYNEINVAENEVAFDRMLESTGKTFVPQIEVDGQWFVGFSKKVLEKALHLDDDFLAGAQTSDKYEVCENCQ